ncbi:S9 family peptidase [Mycolicibacterium sp. P1-18]|uniref:S9 family peptidase n=1 Tax=Mycolicibacterium sp. P1-18 TaxID=2024615 RepID=UPI0011F310FD|nr:S9 family peptidase [Mycolicibacterium sp. P1-18]KAA0094602.1 S9 family peptidase [Mycolicibacterium sp. P1-18]
MTPSPFLDLDEFLALPRVAGLAVSPDGTRAVTTVGELNLKGTEYVTAIWELDVTGERAARRLTHGTKGESSPVFTATGDLLFFATREIPGADGTDEPTPSLWRLPADGGEAVAVLDLAGGVEAVHAARAADVTLVTAPLMPSATDVADDARVRTLRKDAKVSAILHTGYPVRHWDHDIGPAEPHLVDVSGVRDVTPQPGGGLREAGVDLSTDGRFAVVSWAVPGPGASIRHVLVRVDVATGTRTTIADDPLADLGSPAISPDGSAVAFVRESHSTPEHAPRMTLGLLVFGQPVTTVAEDWDRWPASVAWTRDGSALVVTADDGGRRPVFLVDPADSSVTRLTSDDFAYTDVCPAPGGVVFALRSSYAAAPHPVRLDPDGSVTALRCADAPDLPGEVVDVSAVADDGTEVRSWLVLPGSEADEPAPLVLWIHGGPLGSWNSWHWRWNPWLLAARGYAVLMPDPALSTGYGQDFVERGWGAWGFAPYTDLMAATDEALRHPRVDATRTAAMGGSFGGYMANWIAGHTDRFDAIVTHASLWALDQFGPTTDGAYWWAREMTTAMAERNSPHRTVGEIATPTLVIHGDKDYRVPIGEGLRLWFDLLTRSGLPAADDGTSPHRFLYFPTEGHWVLAPQHTKIWYQVILAFLGLHLRGEAEELPDTLG